MAGSSGMLRQGVLAGVVAAVYLGLGLAAAVVVGLRYPRQLVCGFGGSPPLQRWLLGTAAAYTAVGALILLTVALLRCTVVPFLLVGLLNNAFTFAWLIVGSVSLWRDGGDCKVFTDLYVLSTVCVALSFVLCFLNCCGSALTRQSQADVDYEKALKLNERRNQYQGVANEL